MENNEIEGIRTVSNQFIKFPTGMKQKAAASLDDILMIQNPKNMGGDPETLTIGQVGQLLGVGGGGGGSSSTDPIFNTVTISKWLNVGETITMNDLLLRVFRDGVRTYLQAEDKQNPDNEVWLNFYGALLQRVISATFETLHWQQGISGGAMWEDKTMNSHLEVDYLRVRKKATFTNLTIEELTHVGGQVLLTPVSMEVDRVEKVNGGYKLYPKEGEFNSFIENDQARCQKFTPEYSKYYWRLVIAATSEYVILSDTDQDGDGDAPEPGDEIVLLGHRNDMNQNRQAAIMLDSSSDNAPVISIYAGINSYTLAGKWVGAFGKDPLDPNQYGIYVKNGRFENITIGPGCTGLDNFAEYQKLVKDLSSSANRSVDIMPDPSPAFLTKADGTTTPESIVIRVTENNFDSDMGGYRRWYYLDVDKFKLINGQNGKTLFVHPGDEYWNNKSSLTIMYEVEMGDERYSDVTALIKVADGTGSYMAVLDNPYVGISSDYNGVIKEGQLGESGRTRASVIAYAGTTLLQHASVLDRGKYNFVIKDRQNCDVTISKDGTFFYLTNVYGDMGKVIITVNFEGLATMDLTFNWSKTFDGALSSEEIKGEPGDPAYSMDLDNDSATVTTSPDGSGGYWGENVMTTATVLKGGKDISAKYNFALSANPADGISFTSTNNNRTVQVKGMTPDDGFFIFMASPKSTSDPDTYNAPTLQKKFTISKSKQGFQGVQGPGGYVWIVYADDDQGNGLSLSPTGKEWIGIAYAKETPQPPMPLNPKDYQYSLLTGQGVPGPAGSNTYMWIKFSTTYPITDITQVTNDGQAPNLKYMLIAYNQTLQEEDTFPEGEHHDITPEYYNTYYIATEYRGDDGVSLQVQYSSNKTEWHDVFRVNDTWMRQKMSDGVTWSPPMKIVGEDGSDGEYTDFQFSKSESIETPPTTGWQDAPPSLSSKEFLWMRKGVVTPPATEPLEWSTPVILTGPAGTSYWIVPDTRFVNMLAGSPNPAIVRFKAMRGSVNDGVTGWSLGFWKTYYSKDNQKTWNTLNTVTNQVPYVDVTVDPSWTNIRANLYYDNQFTNECDSEVVLIQDVSGVPGKANYVADLDNDSGSTVVDPDGTGGYWGDNVKTRLRIFYGTDNVTRFFTIKTEASEPGLEFVRSDTSEHVQVQVTGFSGNDNDGYVKFTCDPTWEQVKDAVQIVKIFSVTKIPMGEQGPPGQDGKDGNAAALDVQYSVDGKSWHNPPFVTGDLYMRQSVNGGAWSDAMRIVGEEGQKGEDGSYTDYMFAIGSSRVNHDDISESDWTDGPQIPTTAKPWQWMRSRVVQGDGTTGQWKYGIISGVPGADGNDGLPGYAYWISIDYSQVSIKGGVADPKVITATAKMGEGGGGVKNVSMYWNVFVSYDYMKNWASTPLVKPSDGAKDSVAITVSKNASGDWPTNYRFVIYSSSSASTIIDAEVVPVINNDLNDISSLDYVKYALKQMTKTKGGLISTTYIRTGYSQDIADSGIVPDKLPGDWKETAGMYGGSSLAPDTVNKYTEIQFRNKCPRFYSGGSFEMAQASIKYANEKLGITETSYTPPTDKCTFAVSDTGVLYATNAYIEGTIVSTNATIEGKITAFTGEVGPFVIGENDLTAPNEYKLPNGYTYSGGLTLENKGITFRYATGSIYQQTAFIGVRGGFGGYGYDTMLLVEGGDIWHQGVVKSDSNEEGRSCKFYASDIALRGELEVYSTGDINYVSGASSRFRNGSGLIMEGDFSVSGTGVSVSNNGSWTWSKSDGSVLIFIDVDTIANYVVTLNSPTSDTPYGKVLYLVNPGGRRSMTIMINNKSVNLPTRSYVAVINFGSTWHVPA